jgi:hypothetical protein
MGQISTTVSSGEANDDVFRSDIPLFEAFLKNNERASQIQSAQLEVIQSLEKRISLLNQELKQRPSQYLPNVRGKRLKHRVTKTYAPWALPESARPIEDDFSISIPLPYACKPAQRTIGIVAHIFYPEVTHEICRLLENIPGQKRLYISTCSEASEKAIRAIFSNQPSTPTEIRVVQNRGRDIGSKASIFNDQLVNCDLLLFLHSKQSTHSSLLHLWRHYLFETLAGTPETVQSILAMFEADQKLGMVSPQHYELMRQWVNWGANFPGTKRLLGKLGHEISSARPTDFPSGSMFWVRPEALASLWALKIQISDFPPEEGQKDNTLAHQIERGFFHFCEASGYRWIKVASPLLCPNTPSILEPNNRKELIEAIERVQFSVIKPKSSEKIRGEPPTRVFDNPPALGRRIHAKAAGPASALKGKAIAIGIATRSIDFDIVDRSLTAASHALANFSRNGGSGKLFSLHDGDASTPPEAGRRPDTPNGAQQPNNSAVHNRLMKRAFSEGFDAYLALDSDCIVHPDVIAHMMASAFADSSDALVGALLCPQSEDVYFDEYTFSTGKISTSCALITKSVFEITHGLDEQLETPFSDFDFSWRARAHGLLLKVCPQAIATKQGSERKPPSVETQKYLEGICLLAKKWNRPEIVQSALEVANKTRTSMNTETIMSVPEEWQEIPHFEGMLSVNPAIV